ncbi:MAG: carbohydrate-binding family 9-like protein [Candidatus Hydrogenedentes bacterium]|nr:carbohydrate-binding family 9-like protein [Candidatus Hydrogenedentota bacterium]
MRSGRSLAALSLALFIGAAAVAEPIESFENESYPGVTLVQCQGGRVKAHAADGEWALEVRFPGSEKDTWPGLSVVASGRTFKDDEVLCFDVHNPQPEPVHLSYRVDDADGKNVFGGQVLPPDSTTRVEIWLSVLAANLDVARIARFFPYLRMPRKDCVLYFDNFQIEGRGERFERIAYYELAQAPEPTAAEAQLGCYVFRRSELGHVFPNSVLWPGERVEQLALFAAQGEVEPIALSIRALRELDEAAVSVGPLTAGDARLPAEAVELGRVRYLDKKTTYSSGDFIASMPTYVEPGASIEPLPAGAARTFWLRFRVPADAEFGVYASEVTLRTRWAGGEGTMRLPLRLRVLPFALPEAKGRLIGEYYRLVGVRPDEDWRERVTADLTDMRDHGMTSVGLCFGLDVSRVSIENGRVELGFDGTTRFEHFMDTYAALGFPEPVIMLSDSGQPAAAAVAEWGTPEYDTAYKAFWQTAQEACRARGWPELIVQPVDEPGWKDRDTQDRNVHLLKLLKEIPGMRTEQDGPGDAYFQNEAGPHSDVWNYNGAVPALDTIPAIREQHLVAFYNNDVESWRPEVDRYVAGFFQAAAGIDGVYNWEYRGGSGSLYNDMDAKHGDWVHNYLPSLDSAGGPSVAWEGAREGVDDLKYLMLLEQWLDTARSRSEAAGAVAKAVQGRAYLLESLAATPAVRGRAQWGARWAKKDAGDLAHAAGSDPDAAKFVAGTLKQPNGWTLNDYQRARWWAALCVLDLMNACGEKAAVSLDESAGPASFTAIGHTTYPEARRAAAKQTAAASGAMNVVPHLAAAPELDARLDDAAWEGAFRIGGFVPNTGGDAVPVQTEAVLGWHGESLYVGVRCYEPSVKGLVANCQEDGEPAHMDDCVELFFDPKLSRMDFSQLVFSSKGVQWNQSVRGAPWQERVPVKAAVEEGEWRVEAAIPLSEVVVGGPEFGFNLCRERRAGGELELSCWKPTGGQFGTPSAFAAMRLDTAGHALPALESSDAGSLELRTADAFAYTHDILRFEVHWTGPAAALDTGRLRFCLLAEGNAVGEATLGSPVPARVCAAFRVSGLTPGFHETEVALLDAGGATVASVTKRCLVLPAPPGN